MNLKESPKSLPVIERLRVQYPNRNICDVAVANLDNPTEMSEFLIQYAQELSRTSERFETKAFPFEAAVKLIIRLANLQGGQAANRWNELIDTGTVKNVPDHSLDWINPKPRVRQPIPYGGYFELPKTKRQKPDPLQVKPRSAGAKQ